MLNSFVLVASPPIPRVLFALDAIESVVLIIIAGHTDLSIGSLTGLLGGIMAILQVKNGWNTPATILAGCAVGMSLGAWHGFWIAIQGIPAFIVTLTGMFIFRGVGLNGYRRIIPSRCHWR